MSAAQTTDAPLLEIEDLSIGFDSDGGPIAITDHVNLVLRPGEILGLAGESGCGKTVTALSILRLLPSPGGRILGGRILFQGRDILSLPDAELRAVRGAAISMIFQEPSAALNPLLSIRTQLLEVFDYHPFDGDPEARIRELLARVGFPDPDRLLSSYPHQLSGGMLQRVMIAMALLLRPAIIIADEPTTALDVTVQAQIMDLLTELQRESGVSALLITHNLGLIAQYADRIAVMYAGRVVEESTVERFLENPLHPYSQGLLAALPDPGQEGRRLQPIAGQVPQPKNYESGCRFRARCAQAFEPCVGQPELASVAGDDGRRVACFLHAAAGARS
jgi:peptide/nickel transport system ATP-binding protein